VGTAARVAFGERGRGISENQTLVANIRHCCFQQS